MVVEDRFAEASPVGRPDHRLPATAELDVGQRVAMHRLARLDDHRAKEAVAGREALVAETVEVVRPLGLGERHHPLVCDRAVRRRVGIRVGIGRGRDASDHILPGSVDVESHQRRVGERVPESDAEALALVDSQRERLDRVALQADRDARLSDALARPSVLRLLETDPLEVRLEHVHAPLGVVVEVTVVGYVDVDRGQVIRPRPDAGRASCGRKRGRMTGRWGEDKSLGCLVLGGLGGVAVLVRSGEWDGLARRAARDVGGICELARGSRGRWPREDADPEQRDREQRAT